MGQGSQTPTPAEGADNRTRSLRGSLAFPRAGEIAQLVEHTTENRGVPGSSPGLAIKKTCKVVLLGRGWRDPQIGLDPPVCLFLPFQRPLSTRFERRARGVSMRSCAIR